MKRLFALLIAVMLAVSGCASREYEVSVIIPAGRDGFAFSHEMICANRGTVTFSCGEGLGDTEITLRAADFSDKMPYGEVAEFTSYITPGMPVKFDLDDGVWYKIGVALANPTDSDIRVGVKVKGDIRLAIE